MYLVIENILHVVYLSDRGHNELQLILLRHNKTKPFPPMTKVRRVP